MSRTRSFRSAPKVLFPRIAMSLDVWTIVSEYGNKIDKRIELELVKVDRVISGSYEMYSGEDLIGKGNATASRFAS